MVRVLKVTHLKMEKRIVIIEKYARYYVIIVYLSLSYDRKQENREQLFHPERQECCRDYKGSRRIAG